MEQQQQKCRMHAQPQGRDAWWTLVGFIEQLPVASARARRPHAPRPAGAEGARPLPLFYARARGGVGREGRAAREVARLGLWYRTCEL